MFLCVFLYFWGKKRSAKCIWHAYRKKGNKICLIVRRFSNSNILYTRAKHDMFRHDRTLAHINVFRKSIFSFPCNTISLFSFWIQCRVTEKFYVVKAPQLVPWKIEHSASTRMTLNVKASCNKNFVEKKSQNCVDRLFYHLSATRILLLSVGCRLRSNRTYMSIEWRNRAQNRKVRSFFYQRCTLTLLRTHYYIFFIKEHFITDTYLYRQDNNKTLESKKSSFDFSNNVMLDCFAIEWIHTICVRWGKWQR